MPQAKSNVHDAYRQHLVLAEQQSQEAYDKAILSLSGGGLGVSLVFFGKVIDRSHMVWPELLIGAWVAWGLSIAVVIFSFFCSQQALRRAIRDVDTAIENDARLPNKPGGVFSLLTRILNVTSGVLFLLGTILMVTFVSLNTQGLYG